MPSFPIRRARPRLRAANQGFTYLGVLFLIALLAIVSTGASTLASVADQRDKERDLLFAGRQIATALKRYHDVHAKSAHAYPRELTELLGEQNQLTAVRYLRRIYFDPVSGKREWGQIRDSHGGIIGVYSLSTKRPIRIVALPGETVGSGAAKSYQEWRFMADDPASTWVLGALPKASGIEGAASQALARTGVPSLSSGPHPNADALGSNAGPLFPPGSSAEVVPPAASPVGTSALNSDGVYDDAHPHPPAAPVRPSAEP